MWFCLCQGMPFSLAQIYSNIIWQNLLKIVKIIHFWCRFKLAIPFAPLILFYFILNILTECKTCRFKGFKVTSYLSWMCQEKVCHPAPAPLEWVGRIQEHPGLNHSQSLMAGNFAALWPTDSKFSALKDLNLFQTVSKVQEASSILRVGFALSKWPHFNSAYLLRVPYSSGIAVPYSH